MEKEIKKSKKKLIIGLSVSLGVVVFLIISLVISLFIAPKIVLNQVFAKSPLPDYQLVAGNVTYDRYDKDTFPRVETTFLSTEGELDAYYFPNSRSDDLILFIPGLSEGTNSYLPWIKYFYDQGYDLFSFDPTGTYLSEGKTQIGFPQRIIDAQKAIEFINETYQYDNLYVMGHSMGGYASIGVNYFCDNIKASISLAGFNNNEDFMLSFASQYVGDTLVNLTGVFLRNYSKQIFGELSDLNMYDVLNDLKGRAMIVQGTADTVVKYHNDSIAYYQNLITNPDIQYVVLDGDYATHSGILLSNEANAYRIEVNEEFNNLANESYEIRSQFINEVNHSLYTEINQELFSTILEFIQSA